MRNTQNFMAVPMSAKHPNNSVESASLNNAEEVLKRLMEMRGFAAKIARKIAGDQLENRSFEKKVKRILLNETKGEPILRRQVGEAVLDFITEDKSSKVVGDLSSLGRSEIADVVLPRFSGTVRAKDAEKNSQRETGRSDMLPPERVQVPETIERIKERRSIDPFDAVIFDQITALSDKHPELQTWFSQVNQVVRREIERDAEHYMRRRGSRGVDVREDRISALVAYSFTCYSQGFGQGLSQKAIADLRPQRLPLQTVFASVYGITTDNSARKVVDAAILLSEYGIPYLKPSNGKPDRHYWDNTKRNEPQQIGFVRYVPAKQEESRAFTATLFHDVLTRWDENPERFLEVFYYGDPADREKAAIFALCRLPETSSAREVDLAKLQDQYWDDLVRQIEPSKEKWRYYQEATRKMAGEHGVLFYCSYVGLSGKAEEKSLGDYKSIPGLLG